MKLEYNIYTNSIKDIYNYVEYCIQEEYEGSNIFSYNAATYGIIRLIFAGIRAGSCYELLTSTILSSLKGEMSVDFSVESDDGISYVLNFEGASKVTPGEVINEMEKKNRRDLEEMALAYAEYHHGARSNMNYIRFDEEVDKFIRGIENIM